jgi:hypothetical protein
MDKFFDIIKKLRPGVQSGKVSREKALAELMQETGVSEDIAGSAVTKMMPPSGGITTLPEGEVLDVSFKPGVDKRGKRVEESPSQASGFANVDPDILTLGDKEGFKYEMAKFTQKRKKKMDPIYEKYGAQTEVDQRLVDEMFELDADDNVIKVDLEPSDKYRTSSARLFMSESVEDLPGVDTDLITDILYSPESERFLKNQGLDNYINYIHTRFKKELGSSFNKPLLKKYIKEKYDPEGFADGGRIGFKDGVGRKGILSALKNKLNEIAPGSTAVGKTTKAVSDKAKRSAAERELTQDFNRFNKKFPSEEVRKEREILDVPPVPEGFSTSKETLLKQFPELDEEFVETMMQMDKDLLGRTIMMLKDRRKDPELYDKLLEKYGDTLKFQGEFDKATRRKLNAEGGLNYLMGL